MDELPSTEFRKRFARLTELTVVTVNGHVIGTWVPTGAAFVKEGHTAERWAHTFNTRPFTPVPKKGTP